MRGTQFAQLTAFLAVAEHSSFTRAALQLGISPPSLSQAIRSLEEQFGVRLLNRTTRSVALTDAGEELLTHLSPVMDGFEKAVDAINAFRGKPVGTLRLSVHPVAAVTVIAPLIARFAAEYPEIRLDIFVDDECKDIVSEKFDAGIHLGSGIAQDMIAIPIGGKCRLSTVASPDYLARTEPIAAPEDMSEHNCIKYCWAGDDAGHTWKFRSADRHTDVEVKGSLNVNDLEFALRVALDGLGVVQLPDVLAAPYIADGRLARVLPEWSLQWTDFVLYYSSRRHVPVKLRALVDFIREGPKSAQAGSEATMRRAVPARLVNGRHLNGRPRSHVALAAAAL